MIGYIIGICLDVGLGCFFWWCFCLSVSGWFFEILGVLMFWFWLIIGGVLNWVEGNFFFVLIGFFIIELSFIGE